MFAYHQGGPERVKPVPPSHLLADGRADVVSPVRAMGGAGGKVATRVQGGLIVALQELRTDPPLQGKGKLSAWVVPPPKGKKREVVPAEPLYIREARGSRGHRPELYRVEATRALQAAFHPSRMDSGVTPAQKARVGSLLGPLLREQRERKNKQAKAARRNKRRRRDEGATGTVVGGPSTEGGTSRGREDLVDQEAREELVRFARATRDHFAAWGNRLGTMWEISEDLWEEPEEHEEEQEQGGSELLQGQQEQGDSEPEEEDLIDKYAQHDEEEGGGKGKGTAEGSSSEESSDSDSGSSEM